MKNLFVFVISILLWLPGSAFAASSCFQNLITWKIAFVFESTISDEPTNFFFVLVDLGKDKPLNERYRLFEGYLGKLQEVMIGRVEQKRRHLFITNIPTAQIEEVQDRPSPKTVEEAVRRTMTIFHATRHYTYSAPSFFGKERIHIWNSGSAEFGGNGGSAYTKGRFIKDPQSHAIMAEIESFFDSKNPFASLLKVKI